MKRIFFSFFLGLTAINSGFSQSGITYQSPSKEILDLVDVDRAPSILRNSKFTHFIYVYSPMYRSMEDVAQEELRVGGARIYPKTNTRAGINFANKLEIQAGAYGTPQAIIGLPENGKYFGFSFSPDEKFFAFNNVTANGSELWVVDLSTRQAKRLTNDNLNANLGSTYVWSQDSKSLIAFQFPAGAPTYLEKKAVTPTGPTVLQSAGGKEQQNRTYPDLIKSKVDEQNFEAMVTSELVKVNLDGTKKLWAKADTYKGVSFSPDGKYALVQTIAKPYSYLVPFSMFGENTMVLNAEGQLVTELEKRPASDNLPKGFMSTTTAKRSFTWRNDLPSTLYYVQALDNGDPAVKVEFRDEIFRLDAPFNLANSQSITKVQQRYAGISWAKNDLALIYDSWYDTRNSKTYTFNPNQVNGKATLLRDLNTQDKYADPGSPETVKNQYNRYVLLMDGDNIFLNGEGHSPKGQFPFIHQFNLKTKKTTELYRSSVTDKVEDILDIIDLKKGEILVKLEGPTDYPNYYVRNIKNRMAPKAITHIKNPFAAMSGVYKEVVKYKREDGVELSATLYLPSNYDRKGGEKLPMVMWAYPQEFKDKATAGQSTKNPNEFIYPYYGSPIYWVMKGYAVLDDAAFPIVGEGDEEPNNTFIEQLVGNAKAAIDAIDAMGYIDRKRVAVGGHSYGAFMTANLLSHSDLFAAGIARSGAYNRTLTPFGFQGEQRNYWEAKEVYDKMSPFNYVSNMKTPMLLIHGEDDNNPGTFPIQSERYYQALIGFGAPVRYVVLPKESHGYAAKESILHLLWEQDQWLDKHVKNKVVE